eukprot:6193782-Pleurochrysis_carterae.AAC.1
MPDAQLEAVQLDQFMHFEPAAFLTSGRFEHDAGLVKCCCPRVGTCACHVGSNIPKPAAALSYSELNLVP